MANSEDAATRAFHAARERWLAAAQEVRKTMRAVPAAEVYGGYPEGFPPLEELIAGLEAWADPAWDERAPMSTPLRAAAPSEDT